MNKNNLNRIKGILSAKQGTQVPKFQKGNILYNKKTGEPIFRIDQSSNQWFTDENYQNLFNGNLNEYSENPVITIQGGYDTDPNSSVINAAQENQQVQQERQRINVEEISTKGLTRTVSNIQSINEPFTPPTRNASPVETNIKLDKEDRKLSRQMHIEEKIANPSSKTEKNWNTALNIMDGISQIGDAVGAAQMATDSDTTKTATAVYDGISNAMSNAGAFGKIVSGAMQAGKAIGDIAQWAGGGTDQQTKTDQWMDSPFFSWNVGLINGFAGKNTNSFSVDQDVLSQVGSSYGGAAANMSEAAETADKKYGLFSSKARKKANEAITKAKSDQNLMGDIANTASDQRLLVSSMGEQAGLAYSMMTDGGYNQKYTYAAKEGGILEWNPQTELKWEPLIELNWELPKLKEGGNIDIIEELEWIPEFKSGGKTEKFDIPEIEETTQKNVIPEGALHKNKHHMEHAEGLTKKGIPVIDEEGEQQAEIEHSEIIFTLEVTKKLEEYYQIFYSEESTNKEKEQAALDAGKLLVYQILENTEDRTGLIDSCKKGGTLTLKKSTDDLIEEVLEWIPNITIIEEVVEEKPKKESKKSEKEQMKEAIKEVLIEILTK